MVSNVIISLCSVMVAINLLGNSLVCLVVLKDKAMRTPMNFLLVNLAVADMIVGVFSTFRLVSPKYNRVMTCPNYRNDSI